ncbi:MAG: GNAT family N-acetyltransferase [Actinobacteria bacterium]|nr:GNAT family N-acetyltransferase [Actinomycetota bacterium]
MITLTTDRLRLRPFTEVDLPAVLGIHRHPGIARFIPSAVCATEDDARAALTRFAGYDDGLLGIPAIELRDGPDAGQVVGLVMLKPIPPSGSQGAATATSPALRPPAILPGPSETWDIEIGWRAHPSHTGRGYIAEASRAVLAHGLTHGLDRVVAVTDPENLPSQRVAERIGMRRVGISRDYYDEVVVLFEALRPA